MAAPIGAEPSPPPCPPLALARQQPRTHGDECTRRMRGTNSGRLPNLYRPTFLPTSPKGNCATFDFEKFKTMDEAKQAAQAMRTSDKRIDRGKKRIAMLHRLPNRNPTEGA